MDHLPIIYVEDSRADAEMFSQALLQMRLRSTFIHFRDGESAQAFLAKGVQPEFMAIDINLPGIGGKDLIRWIREQEWLRSMPVFALSGTQAFKHPGEIDQIGATLFFLKPPNYGGWIDLVYQIDDFLSPT